MGRSLSRIVAPTTVLAVLLSCNQLHASIVVHRDSPLADGLFAVYEQNRKDGTPNYITEDLILLSYSMIRVDVARSLERGRSVPRLGEFIEALGQAVSAAADNEAAGANRDYLAVLQALLDGQQKPAGARSSERANAELDLVLGATGIRPSPLWGRQMDYSQFRPRGHYADDERLARYFRAVRYAGAVLFPVQPSKATGVGARQARRAALQARALADLIEGDAALATLYHGMLDALTWAYGPPEDLTNADIRAVAPEPSRNYGARLLAYARENGAQPRIIGEVVDRSKLEAGVSLADVLTGWRLLPQRRTPESEAFQGMVFDATGEYTPRADQPERPFPQTLTLIDGKPVKGFPLLGELMCMWGSQTSCDDLIAWDEARFHGYPEALQSGRQVLAAAEGLSALLRPVLVSALRDCAEHCGDRLTAMRAFWTWQRYAAVLYAKQSYTPTGKGIRLHPPRRPGAQVQPSLALYMGLARAVEDHRRITPHPSWDAFAAILEQLIEVAARHDLLATEDETFLNDLDADLKDLTGGADEPIVVDIHSNPARGEVLYEATGLARVVDDGNRPWTAEANARGARFSQCEFFGPIESRLTDAQWRERMPDTSSGEGEPFTAGSPCPGAEDGSPR